jgi:exodeoxyribonuclease VII small subunit
MAKNSPKTEDEKSAPPTFEQALVEIEAIVRDLEEGRIGLEASLARYEQGVGLLRRCYELLAQAERRIELVRGVDADGNPVTTPLEDDSGTLQQKAARRSRRRSIPDDPPPTDCDLPEDDDPHVDESGRLF